MGSFTEIVRGGVAEAFVVEAEVTQDLLLCPETIEHFAFQDLFCWT
jgi:hypothetical protein